MDIASLPPKCHFRLITDLVALLADVFVLLIDGAQDEAEQEDTNVGSETTEERQGQAAIQAVLSGAVAQMVYKSAIAAIPTSIDFRHCFLTLLSQSKFDGCASIQQAILDSIRDDFGDTEEAWDLRARAACATKPSDAVSQEVHCSSLLHALLLICKQTLG